MPVSITVESASVARARKRKRTAITLLVVAAILAGSFYYAASYWNRPARTNATCTPTLNPTGPVSPRQVTLNVYNATNRSGLAASVSRLAKERGFVLGTVANDPAKKQIKGPAEVRFGPAGERAAPLVQALVAGAVPVKDTRADASVDLVLGDAYTQLAPAPTNSTQPATDDGC
jgi:hypothetical protein